MYWLMNVFLIFLNTGIYCKVRATCIQNKKTNKTTEQINEQLPILTGQET